MSDLRWRYVITWIGCLFCLHGFSQNNSSEKKDSLVIYFDTNIFTLSPSHKKNLSTVFSSQDIMVQSISGYTDQVGTNEDNLLLSEKRMRSVANFLESVNQLHTSAKLQWFGEMFASEVKDATNRKVVILYSKKQTTKKENSPSQLATEKLELDKLYFVPDQPIIESTSLGTLDITADRLKKMPACNFEIVGHVNYVARIKDSARDEAYLPFYKLSEDRAKEVYLQLIDRGIPASRMKYKGVGNSQMVYKKPTTEEEMRKNMRVEIFIYCP